MKLRALCSLLLLALFGCAAPTSAPSPTRLPTREVPHQDQKAIMQKLDRYFSRQTNKDEFSGVVLVAQGGTTLLRKAYGMANIRQEIPNTVETRFQLASVSKPLTTTAIMQLVERGQIRLDATVGTYLAQTPGAWDKITVVQLLSHTSGIPDYFTFDEFDGVLDLTPDGVIEVAKKYPLDFDPGSEYSYSNTGFVMLGKIIESVTGKSYGAYMRESIFDPLQMTATGRDGDNAPLAVGYDSYNELAEMFPITNALADGDFVTTVDDLYKFDRALYGDTLLSRVSREAMWKPISTYNYGLGWEVQTWQGRRVVSHSGSINGFQTELMRFPEDDSVIIVLSNLHSFDPTQAAWDAAKILFP